MHAIVCVKVVPRPEEVSVNRETNTLDRARARQILNPPDLNALELALQLKDRHGGSVSLLSMGPPFFEQHLRALLAMGADAAYLLSDRAFGGADTLPTSLTLARGIEKIGAFDLVLCGEESSDGATGQVPPGIAEWLDLPQITYARELQLRPAERKLVATRAVRAGHQVVEAPTPAVVSVLVGVNEPRFLDFQRLAWARQAPVVVWSAADLGLDPAEVGGAGSATSVVGVGTARAAERRREFLTGDPEEKARQLFERIRVYLPRSEGDSVAGREAEGRRLSA